MSVQEGVCLGIVLLWVVPRFAVDTQRGRLALRLLLIALAAWLGEASCIRLYGFYGYDDGPWTLRLPGGVPVLVPLIWPVVIHSAWDLVRRLMPTRGTVAIALACGGVVFADAALIEPVAVHAGLWSWTEPGLFAVPPVGVLGWGAFSALVVFALDHSERTQRSLPLVGVLLASLWIHPILLALWWGACRWINGTVPPAAAIAVFGVASLLLFAWTLKARPANVRWPALARAPGAAFFVGLLAVQPPPAELALWAAVFVPPYLALLAVGARSTESASSEREPDLSRSAAS